MKFCKNLQRVVDISDPEWSPYWVNYKMLKVRTHGAKREKIRVLFRWKPVCTVARISELLLWGGGNWGISQWNGPWYADVLSVSFSDSGTSGD